MMPSNIAAEVETLKLTVAKYFAIYDIKVAYDSLTFYVSPDKKALDKSFDAMRRELFEKHYVPLLRYSGGEYTISIVRKPALKRRGIWINYIFLVLTLITTTFSGALYWADYSGSGQVFSLDSVFWGLVFFAIPLMAILGTHELSHYLMSKRHGVEASLPFFIPAPPLIGTFGAFISMRDPMPNRKALIEIGIAGPIGGLIVTIPIAILGLMLTAGGPIQSGGVGDSGAMAITFQPLYQLFLMLVPLPDNVALHPLAFAAWVGFLVTAINLLPAGQLDGGHVARGLLGDKARYLSIASVILLGIMGILFYDGWIIFALLILLLGLRHPAPLDDVSKLSVKSQVLGALGIVILLVTFVPTPLTVISPNHAFEMTTVGESPLTLPLDNNTSISAGGSVVFEIQIKNSGNTNINSISADVVKIPSGWNAVLYQKGGTSIGATSSLRPFDLGYGNSTSIMLNITAQNPSDARASFLVNAQASDGSYKQSIEYVVNVS